MADNKALLICFNRFEARSAIRPLATCRTLHFFFPSIYDIVLSLEPRTDYALPHQGCVDNNGCGLVLVYKARLILTTSRRLNTSYCLLSLSAHDCTLFRTLTTSSRTSAERTSLLLQLSFFVVMVTAYLRSLFGSQATPGHGKAKSRRRTESIPTPAPHYIYAAPHGNTPTSISGTSLSKAQRANSYSTTPAIVPSPLRYPTYDSRASHEGSRPAIKRSASYKPPSDVHGPYP